MSQPSTPPTCFAQFPQPGCPVDRQRRAALTSAQLTALSGIQIGALTTAQVAVLDSDQIDGLSTSQVAALTSSQVIALAPTMSPRSRPSRLLL